MVLDFRICVDPLVHPENSFKYRIKTLKDVNCIANNRVYPLVDSEGGTSDALTYMEDQTANGNGIQFVSVLHPMYFENRNTKMFCSGEAELIQERTRGLEASVDPSITSSKNMEFGVSIELEAWDFDRAHAGNGFGTATTTTIFTAIITVLGLFAI